MNRLSLDPPHIHVMVVHFPIVLSVVALVAAFSGLIFASRSAWLFAMSTLSVAGAIAYPVYWSGDQARHFLKRPWYVQKDAIGVHSSAALVTVVSLIACGAFCTFAWWRTARNGSRPIPSWVRAGVMFSATASTASAVYTAFLGGLIIHDAPILRLPSAPAGFHAAQESPPVERPD